MRSLATFSYSLALACGSVAGITLHAASQAPQSTSPPQVISVGQEVIGQLNPDTYSLSGFTPAVFEVLFELTAPSDATLIISLNWNADWAYVALVIEDAAVSYWPTWRAPTVASLPAVAGQTYRFSVSTNPWDLFGSVPFVLSTSIEPGIVPVPPGCTFAPPAIEWICVDGGWVPPGHPLALPAATPPTPSQPAVITIPATACTTVQPDSTWVCANGGWVPPNHPLASPPPSAASTPPASAPASGCPGPDPFIGIPGMAGVCVNGGWVPVGHPLARGGG